MANGRSKVQSKLRRCMTAPYRALCRARDLYEKRMAGCSGEAQRVVVPCARSHYNYYGFHTRPQRSDFDEDENANIEKLMIRAQVMRGHSRPTRADVAQTIRSMSVAAMRIDEERPCSFEGDVKVGLGTVAPKFPGRSRSCAAAALIIPSRAAVIGVAAWLLMALKNSTMYIL